MAAAGRKLTALAVANARAKRSRVELPDLASGLFLVVQPSGAKSWAVRYRIDGRTRKLTVGPVAVDGKAAPAGALTLAAARVAAKQAIEEVTLGRDPAEAKRKKREAAKELKAAPVEDSVKATVEKFLEQHAEPNTRASSCRHTRAYLRRISARWADRKVGEIRRRDVIDVIEAIARKHPYAANRMLAALSKFFNWAVGRDLIAASPCHGVERPGREVARDRVLKDGELVALWKACGGGNVAEQAVRLLILTGCRRGEVGGMRWDELDPERRIWTVPAERSKNRKAHEVPLVPAAWDIIEAMPRIGPCVFSAKGERPTGDFYRLKPRLDAELGFKPWRLHDIRRSVASGLQRLGIRVEVIEALLGHLSGVHRGIVGVYQRHDFAAERRAALTQWADHLERLLSGKPATAVPLHAGWR